MHCQQCVQWKHNSTHRNRHSTTLSPELAEQQRFSDTEMQCLHQHWHYLWLWLLHCHWQPTRGLRTCLIAIILSFQSTLFSNTVRQSDTIGNDWALTQLNQNYRSHTQTQWLCLSQRHIQLVWHDLCWRQWICRRIQYNQWSNAVERTRKLCKPYIPRFFSTVHFWARSRAALTSNRFYQWFTISGQRQSWAPVANQTQRWQRLPMSGSLHVSPSPWLGSDPSFAPQTQHKRANAYTRGQHNQFWGLASVTWAAISWITFKILNSCRDRRSVLRLRNWFPLKLRINLSDLSESLHKENVWVV